MDMSNGRVFSKELITNETLRQIKREVSRDNFLSWLNRNYDVLRCYHGCRPTNVQSYYINGFRPSDIDKSLRYFETLLKDIQYPYSYNISEVLRVYTGSINKYIYFILDREDFIDGSPHYIIYGSELILSLAQNVNEHIKYHLRKIGIPTIFHCDIPFNLIEAEELLPIYDNIVSAKGTFKQKVFDIFSNYTIILRGFVDGCHIVHHEHPSEELYDFHAKEIYKNNDFVCSACKTQD